MGKNGRVEVIAGVSQVLGRDAALSPGEDSVTIRGRQLPISELLDHRFWQPGYRADIKSQMAHAKPFEHVVLEDLFNPLLLELVLEEFEQTSAHALDALVTEHEFDL